ncbi:hypothetical protein M409DRAFT_22825 [Zasmidium cellare ATCC 36951]|uniref:Uncharacterized protein n=1 Tax=Zasmidium cellare ATCC 36951 TaxID=1080233 RepID=A0A6A6CIB4_ZASCE|nr:uncharacterized protein M409DRAFT_22825 [Zasmidium cellare ATCC 36951]KAF2166771.1 hypothetical protein M409DRAFT_22825 [Zasmidium cellare ATCC 36951]
MSSTGVSPELWHRIPFEVWTSTFYCLSDRRVGIANCRLTCRAFNTASSQFLITRVVVAKRSESLQQTVDVLEHPFFRQHVTELVYDGTYYLFRRANNIHKYWRSRDVPRKLRKGAPEFEETWTQLSGRVSKGMSALGSHYARYPSNLSLPLGYHSSFIEYSKRWLDQEHIRHRTLPLAVLQMCLSQLPKLRTVTYTDYLYLALGNEAYEALRTRLFGSVAPPRGIDLSCEKDMVEFLQMMRIIRDTPGAQIQNLGIGSIRSKSLAIVPEPGASPSNQNFWSYPMHFGVPCVFLPYTEEDEALRNLADDDGDPIDDDIAPTAKSLAKELNTLTSHKNLKHLRMPAKVWLARDFGSLRPEVLVPKSNMMSLLRSCESSLVSLRLCAVYDRSDLCNAWRPGFREVAVRFLTCLLDGLSFSSLQHLVLQDWWLPGDDFLKEFLSRHYRALGEVRLVNCVESQDGDVFQLGEWVGQNMNLKGVELDLWRDLPFTAGLADMTTNDAHPSPFPCYATIPDGVPCTPGEPDDRPRKTVLSPDPRARSLEVLWLAGRTNHLCVSTRPPRPNSAEH